MVAVACSLRRRRRAQRAHHRCGGRAGFHQVPIDHSLLHGGPDGTALARVATDGWLVVLWAGVIEQVTLNQW